MRNVKRITHWWMLSPDIQRILRTRFVKILMITQTKVTVMANNNIVEVDLSVFNEDLKIHDLT